MQWSFARSRIAGVKNLSILLLGLYACGADTALGPEDQGPEQLQVDAGGTTVSAQNGNVSLTVPEGAVAAATTITVIRVSEEPADPGLIPGTLYDFGPDGLQFAEPVTLRLTYDPTALPVGATEDRLRIFKRAGSDGTFTPNGADWLPTANGSVDVSTATVTGDINGFSHYGIVFFPLLEVSTDSVPFGVEGVNYWEVNGGGDDDPPHLGATGGDGNYSWTVVAGELPAGLILAGTGYFEGISTTVGTTDATLQITSGDGQAAQQAFSITVRPRPILAPSELCTDYPGYAIGTFADANLEAAIRSVKELPGEFDLSCATLAGLHSFETNNAGITSLVGFQNLTGMKWLDLSDNAISDISALSGLTDLLALELQFNSITDISPLAGLTGLTFLDIDDNTIVDVGALSQLTSMEFLELKNNSITDIGSLAGMTSLRTLIADNNSIQDVTALGELTALTGLWLDNNRVAGITPLATLVNLTNLRLAGNSIDGGLDHDFDPLTPFRSSLSALQSLTNLERLDLSDNALGGIEPLLNFQPLLNNAGLGSGDIILLDNTGVFCTVVNTLRDRGANVSANPLLPGNACETPTH